MDSAVTTHFEKNTHFDKFYQSALNLGPSQRTMKKYFFPKCVNIGHINALWKRMINVLSPILLIVRSYFKVVKLYRWDKCKSKHFLHIRFCQHISPSLYTGNSFLPLPDIFGHKFAKVKVMFLSYFRKTSGWQAKVFLV